MAEKKKIDEKYFTPIQLTDWLNKTFSEKFCKFDVYYKGEKIASDQKEKLESEPSKDFTIKMRGNPYKIKEYLPDGWDFDGKDFVNKNKEPAEHFKLDAMNKEKPLNSIKDELDLLYTLEVLNPGTKIYKTEAGEFQTIGKPLDDMNYPSGFSFNNGEISNRGNVSDSYSRQISVKMSVSKEEHSYGAKTLGEKNALGGDLDDLNEESGNPANRPSTDNYEMIRDREATKIQDLVLTPVFMQQVANFSVGDLVRLYENYKTAIIDGELKLMYAGTDSGNGQIVEDESLFQSYLFAKALIQNFKNDEVLNPNDAQYGEINLSELETMLEEFKNNPEAAMELINKSANIELGEEETSNGESNVGEDTVEEALKESQDNSLAEDNYYDYMSESSANDLHENSGKENSLYDMAEMTDDEMEEELSDMGEELGVDDNTELDYGVLFDELYPIALTVEIEEANGNPRIVGGVDEYDMDPNEEIQLARQIAFIKALIELYKDNYINSVQLQEKVKSEFLNILENYPEQIPSLIAEYMDRNMDMEDDSPQMEMKKPTDIY